MSAQMPAQPRRHWPLVVAAGAALAFCLLAAGVARGATAPFDQFIRGAVHAGHPPYLATLAAGVSFFGRLAVLIPASLLLAAAFLLARRRSPAIALITTMAGALALNASLKMLIHRPRPAAFYGVDPETYSFPSGHVFFTACFCGALGLIVLAYRKSAVPLAAGILPVLAIGWSRVYLGVHYPTDVAAGLLAATAWLGLLFGCGLFRLK